MPTWNSHPDPNGAGEPAAGWLAQILHGWANQIAARFNAPVYLVGSALKEAKPRDVDIRVVLTDEAFRIRYGISADRPHFLGPEYGDPEDELVRRYWRDVAKLGEWCAMHHATTANERRGLNVDFQVQSDAMARAHIYETQPRVRLDTLGDLPVVEQ